MATKPLKIAVIPGDGIGAEVMPYGVDCLQAIGDLYDIPIEIEEFEFASVAYYEKHGFLLPEDLNTILSPFDAIYLGALGIPNGLPHDETHRLWHRSVRLRMEFEQCVNLRPYRLIEGVKCPLADRRHGDVDFWIVCDNTGSENSSIHHIIEETTDREQESRPNVDRVLKYAFDLARSRTRKRLTSVERRGDTNTHITSWWDSRVREMAKKYPDVSVDWYSIDLFATHLAQKPDIFDVVVGRHLPGETQADIDLACFGTACIAPSASISPEGKFPSLFEPVRGSEPGIAGKGIANPIGVIWAGQMLLQHLGHAEAADALLRSVENVLVRSQLQVLTPDMGGTGTTQTLGEAVINEIMSFQR